MNMYVYKCDPLSLMKKQSNIVALRTWKACHDTLAQDAWYYDTQGITILEWYLPLRHKIDWTIPNIKDTLKIIVFLFITLGDTGKLREASSIMREAPGSLGVGVRKIFNAITGGEKNFDKF